MILGSGFQASNAISVSFRNVYVFNFVDNDLILPFKVSGSIQNLLVLFENNAF